ncbi:MAG TPA: lamin tail domain-containing protein, partial [Candidatus Saccharimonadales bacterium]|nr:lamin tail domain-containing protein [Candidatus Saccharimonadales bacterium]
MRPCLPHGVVPTILIVMASVCRPGSSTLFAVTSIFVVASGEFARIPAAEPIPRTEAARVVINEIHFAPPQKRPLEFVELYNPSSNEVRLAAWTLDKFTFPSTAVIPSRGFAVIAQDPKAFAAEFGFAPLGPLPGKLSRHGEHLTLRDATGAVVEELTYGVGFPWPTAAAGGGSSLERIHPNLPANDPGAWRSAGYPVTPAAAGTVFIPVTDPHWRWRKGTAEASSPREAWRRAEFKEDSSWQTGRTSIGYGDDDDETLLTDMRGRYTSIFLRHSFVIDRGVPLPAQLLLRVRVDDGCVAWINGQEVHRWHVRPGELPFDAVAENHEATDFEEAILPNAPSLLRTGTNLLALQVFNASRDSSDLSIDAELRTAEGAPARRHPTPGAPNSVFSSATPPSLLAVDHQPPQPKSGQAVVVTARFREGQSLTNVTLSWQVVEPGRYTRKSDPEYATNWSVAPMRDDGREGDVRAGDGVFTAVVPATWQKHRRLVRYRVRATNSGAVSVSAPQEDDDSPNFAWFVFDGLPAWTGASHPGKTPAITFSPEFLGTLPSYHLLARSADVAQSQWNGDANRRRFFGTLVYDGRVYDHIQFHNRGSGSAYISGKNKWGLKFNRAHEL